MSNWLVNESAREVIGLRNEHNITAADRAAYEEKITAGPSGKTKVENRVAYIPINGLLTEDPDFWAYWSGLGNTTYKSIRAAVLEAEALYEAGELDKAVFDVTSSPGGNVTGLFETMQVVKDSSMPTKTLVRDLAASATYMLISQTDDIQLLNRATQVGSVGVMRTMRNDEQLIRVTNTESPDKNPDAATKAGLDVVKSELDDLFDVFAEKIADGRNTAKSEVVENFGRGRMVIAEKAVAAGMVDGIINSKEQSTSSSSAAVKTPVEVAAHYETTASAKSTRIETNIAAPEKLASSDGSTPAAETGTAVTAKEVESMDLTTLKSEHPEIYAAVLKEGEEKERKRVNSHLTMGEKCKAMPIALKAIKEGTELDGELTADYVASLTNANDIEARTDDNQDTGDAGAAAGSSSESVEDYVAKQVCAMLGASDDDEEEV